MSADNGIYILKTPARPIKEAGSYINQHGKFEYRVAHCLAIENIDYSDLYVPLLFGDSPVFDNEEKAMELAIKLANDCPILEYGICQVSKHYPFPNMTSSEAKKALDSYVLE